VRLSVSSSSYERLLTVYSSSAIIALSCLEFIFSISSILADYLKDSSCICTNSCSSDSVILELFEYFSLFITGTSSFPSKVNAYLQRDSDTGFFMLEIPADLLAFGITYYLSLPHHAEHWFLHLFDAIVIIGAFILAVGAQVRPISHVSLPFRKLS